MHPLFRSHWARRAHGSTAGRLRAATIAALGFAWIVFAGPPALFGQGKGGIDQRNADAIDQAELGDARGAAELVGARNSAAKDTLPWYQQSAGELLRSAYILRARMDYEGSRRAGLSAIRILLHGYKSQGAKTAAAEKAQTSALIGLIYEDVIGDSTSADAYYTLAIQDDGENELAKQRVSRRRAEESIRGSGKGGKP